MPTYQLTFKLGDQTLRAKIPADNAEQAKYKLLGKIEFIEIKEVPSAAPKTEKEKIDFLGKTLLGNDQDFDAFLKGFKK